MITVTAKIAPLLRDLRRMPGQLQRVARELVETEARGFVRDAVQSTPPFFARPTDDDPGKFATVKGGQAKKNAEAKIDREAAALFVPVQIKGKRQITHVFGKKLVRPVTVPTTEKHPDVSAIWDERTRRRFATRRKSISRGQKAGWYVARPKLLQAIRERKKNIGKLASGWSAAAAKLNVKLPAWVSRHGTGRGQVLVKVGSSSYSVRIENRVPYGDALQLQAIADRAMKIRSRKLEARLPHVLRGAIRRAQREALAAA